MGDIVGDLNRRRGQVSDMGDRAGAKTVKATVPPFRNVWICNNIKNIIFGSCNVNNWNFHIMQKHLQIYLKK